MGGQDMVLQSISGATWHNRDADGRPAIFPTPFVDFGSGMALVQGILMALLERNTSGLGQRVDVSLLDTALFAQMQEYTQWMMRRFENHWERDSRRLDHRRRTVSSGPPGGHLQGARH
jgi:formyl-CoA transferase